MKKFMLIYFQEQPSPFSPSPARLNLAGGFRQDFIFMCWRFFHLPQEGFRPPRSRPRERVLLPSPLCLRSRPASGCNVIITRQRRAMAKGIESKHIVGKMPYDISRSRGRERGLGFPPPFFCFKQHLILFCSCLLFKMRTV